MRNKLDQLFRSKYDSYVKRMSYRVGSTESAEDVVMESFARALKYSDSYTGGDDNDSLERWFNTIMVNAARDFKKDQHMNGMTTGLDEAENEVVFDKIEDANMLRRIEKRINRHKEPTRSILHFIFIKGYKPKEVQDVVPKTSMNAIWVMAHRFRQTMLEDYGDIV